MTKSHAAVLDITKGDRGQVGLRGLREHGEATAADTAVRGSVTVLARRKWRIDNIPNGKATRGQVADAAQSVGWTADIAHVGYDSVEKINFAIARSDTEPTNKYWKFGTAKPWVATEVTPGVTAAAKGLNTAAAPIVALAAKFQTTAPPPPPSSEVPAPGAAGTPCWLADLQGKPPEAPGAPGRHGGSASAQVQEPPSPSAPARLPDAEHKRIEELEASVKAQKVVMQAMQASLVEQEASAAPLNQKPTPY